MRIIIDQIYHANGTLEAQMVIHTDVSPNNKIDHPTIPGTKLDHIDFIALCAQQKPIRTAAGYDTLTGCAGAPIGATRWDMVKQAALKPEAEPALKAINFGQ